jgi:hypothetical protein
MRLRHGLASLIWAAIFLIAAQFVAGSAFAHSGHSHDHLADSQSSAASAAHQGQAAPKLQVVEEENADLSVTSLEHGDPPASTRAGGCTGGCCGNGIGCCGAVIAASFNSLPNFRAQQASIPLANHCSSGIDPEALRRPPRTIA